MKNPTKISKLKAQIKLCMNAPSYLLSGTRIGYMAEEYLIAVIN